MKFFNIFHIFSYFRNITMIIEEESYAISIHLLHVFKGGTKNQTKILIV